MGIDTTKRRVIPMLEANALSLLVSRVIAAIATTAVFALAAHQLSTRDFGLVASTLAAGFLANSLVTFGTDTLVTREVAADDLSGLATARSALRLQLSSAALLITFTAVAWSFGASGLLLAQAVVLLPQAVVTVAGAVVRGRQKMASIATSALAGAIVALAATIGGFAMATTPFVPIAALGAGALASAAVLTFTVVRSPRLTPMPTASSRSVRLGSLLRTTAPFASMVVLAAVGAQGGLLLVEFITDEPTGGYGAAVRLAEAGRLVPAAVIGAFFPAMVGGAHRTSRYRQWMRLLAGYTVAATAVLIATASLVNQAVFDSQPDGTALIRIIALSLIFTLTRLALSFEAIAEGNEHQVVRSALIGTIVLVGLGTVFAGPWGARGVAVAHVAGIGAATAYLGLVRYRSATAGKPPASSMVGMRKLFSGHR